MQVKTIRDASAPHGIGLVVEKADPDGDVYVGTHIGGFYIDRRDVPRLINALKWAVSQ